MISMLLALLLDFEILASQVPARMENEIGVMYVKEISVGYLYSFDEMRYPYYPQKFNKVHYFLFEVPIKTYYVRGQVGTGDVFDFEIATGYRFNKVELDVGYSLMDKFIISLKLIYESW